MTQATWKTQESWDQSGKDPTRLRKHSEKEHTSCVTWMGVSCPARGISAISRNATFSEPYGVGLSKNSLQREPPSQVRKDQDVTGLAKIEPVVATHPALKVVQAGSHALGGMLAKV
ncbi:hypothetical protein Tco_1463826 [Tanacetum coccineum]